MFSIGNYAFISYFKKIQVSDRSIQRCPKLCSLLTFLKLKTLAFDPLVPTTLVPCSQPDPAASAQTPAQAPPPFHPSSSSMCVCTRQATRSCSKRKVVSTAPFGGNHSQMIRTLFENWKKKGEKKKTVAALFSHSTRTDQWGDGAGGRTKGCASSATRVHHPTFAGKAARWWIHSQRHTPESLWQVISKRRNQGEHKSMRALWWSLLRALSYSASCATLIAPHLLGFSLISSISMWKSLRRPSIWRSWTSPPTWLRPFHERPSRTCTSSNESI